LDNKRETISKEMRKDIDKVKNFSKSINENKEDGKITVEYWLKNNIEWCQPQKKVELSAYDNVELLSRSYYGDLFYAYNNGDIENGRLFRGRWNKGIF
jgi:hypothetical protein